MKGKIILLLLFVANVSVFAQNVYNISFDKADFTFEKDGDLLNIIPSNLDYFFLSDTLLPALPYKTYNILRPEYSLSGDYDIVVTKEKIYDNILIRSNPQEMPVSLINPVNIIHAAKASVLTPVSYVGYNFFKGHSMATYNITPFIYDVTSHELYFVSKITITLKQERAHFINRRRNASAKSTVLKMVMNPNDFSNFYPTAPTEEPTISSNNVVDYLVITTEGLKNDFIPLIHWKAQKGLRAKIITLDSIYSKYDGETNQLKIKNCLNDYYLNNGLKWVLLGGDDTVVPAQGGYVYVKSRTIIYTYTDAPVDLFYACFDKAFDWDANGNGLIGETVDDIDMYPEIYVSRLPVRTKTHVKSFVDKLLKYEKEAHSSSYINSMLLTGTEQWNTWSKKSDAHWRSEVMYKDYISPYWNGNKSYLYDTGSSMAGDANYNLTASNLQDQINQGYHFMHMATHGASTTWAMESGPSYNSNNASAQNNADATIIATTACNTNWFDNSSDPCLSETFIRNPKSCIAYFGSSRYGWGYNDTLPRLGHSLQYNASFFKNLFTGEPSSDRYKFGAIVALTKQQKVGSSYAYNAYRWLQFTLNPIGDPEMDIYTETPSTFSNVSVIQDGTFVTVNTGGINDCKIVVCSKEDNGESYFSVIDSTSNHTFTNVDVPCSITILKHNYTPYIFNEDVLIQNKTFTGTNVLVGKNVKIGKNVNPNATQGEVKITNGANVTVDAEKNVVLDAGFKCEKGGTLKIK